jgi:hypothetical protein
MRYFHDMHEMNAYRVGHVDLSVCPHDSTREELDGLDEIWYGCYAIWDYPKIVLYNFLQSVIPTWRANKVVRWDRE